MLFIHFLHHFLRSSNFFLAILLSALLLCTVPVGYVITSKRPSTLCGPFAGHAQFYDVVTDLIEGHVPKKVMRWLKYVASPGVIIPIILLLILFIFFLVSLVRGLRKANTDLQKQLIHERTEEKRKIFELAGGGNRRKGTIGHGQGGQQQQQKAGRNKLQLGQHLPEVERRRREPWRLFNGSANKGGGGGAASSLCPSDEPPSTLGSPTGFDQSPEEQLADRDQQQQSELPRDFVPSQQQVAQPPKSGGGWAAAPMPFGGFRPSLSSLEEVESGRTASSIVEQPSSRLRHLAQEEGDWDGQQGSRPSTPEELRTLVAPYHLLPAPSASSNSRFPPPPPTLPNMPVSPDSSSCSALASSRREDTSVYEELELFGGGGAGSPRYIDASARTAASSASVLSAALPLPSTRLSPRVPPQRPTKLATKGYRNPSLKSSSYSTASSLLTPLPITNLIQSPRLIPPSHLMTRSDVGIPSVEAPHRISLYAREPRRIGLPPPTPPAAPVKLKSASPPARQPPSATTATAAKVPPQPPPTKKSTDQFVPWPSPDEVRRQRAHLLRPTSRSRDRGASTATTASSATVGKPATMAPRARSPPKMIKSVHSSELTPPPPDQPRRFRITVSPSRQAPPQQVAEQPGTTTATPPRRYLIKQQVFTGSCSTIGSSSVANHQNQKRSTVPQKPDRLPVAPRAVFGEDDSPRVEQPPPPPPRPR